MRVCACSHIMSELYFFINYRTKHSSVSYIVFIYKIFIILIYRTFVAHVVLHFFPTWVLISTVVAGSPRSNIIKLDLFQSSPWLGCFVFSFWSKSLTLERFRFRSTGQWFFVQSESWVVYSFDQIARVSTLFFPLLSRFGSSKACLRSLFSLCFSSFFASNVLLWILCLSVCLSIGRSVCPRLIGLHVFRSRTASGVKLVQHIRTGINQPGNLQLSHPHTHPPTHSLSHAFASHSLA